MSLTRRLLGAAMTLAVVGTGLSIAPAVQAQSSSCSQSEPPDQMKVEVLNPTGSQPRLSPSVPVEVEVTNTWSKTLPTQPDPTITRITTRLLSCREGQVLPDEMERSTSDRPAKTLRLKWDPEPIPTNGPYVVEIIATGNRPGNPAQQSRVVVPFSLAVPPKRPAGVTATVEGGSVNISWSLQGQELDLVVYEVQRAASGSNDYTTVSDGVVGASVSSVKDKPGTGTWRYRVLAIRRGAGESEGVRSAPSSDAAAEIAPPTTTTSGSTGSSTTGTSGSTARIGTGSSSTSSTVTTGRPGPGGTSTVNLSTYSAGLLARRQATRIGERDTGFSEALPFTPRGARPADELGSEAGDDEEPQELGSDAPNQGLGQRLIFDEGDRRRSLGFVAFGLLLFVLSMTGLFLKSEVKRADELDSLDPLPPEGGPPVGPDAPAPPASPAPAHDPAPALEARPWTVAAAPVAPQPQPEPEANPQPQPLGGWQRQPDPQPEPDPQPQPLGGWQRQPDPQPPAFRERRARRRSLQGSGPMVPPAPPTDPAGFSTDLSVVGFDDLTEPAAVSAPVRRPHRTVAPSDAPSLDIPDPAAAAGPHSTTRTRTPAHARRTSTGVSSRSADDRREGGSAVRPRRRRTRQGD